jgi:hypothetical protein
MDKETPALKKERSPRDEVLLELAAFLRQRNATPDRRPAFLDRPIVLTLIGGVLLTLLTTWWQVSEKRTELDLEYARHRMDQKSELLRSLPSVYEKSGNILNQWLMDVLWMADEQNKHSEKRVIKSYSSEILGLQADFGKTENPEGILRLIQVEFVAPTVRTSATEMLDKWKQFTELLTQTNREYSLHQSLTPEQIQQLGGVREIIRKDLNSDEEHLTQEAARELAGG